MTRYELLYIIPTTLTDEDAGAVETKVKGLLEKHGATVETTNRLGKFRLAYPIKDVRHGHYVLSYFTAEPANIAKLDENLRITTEVLRHLLLRADEAGGDKFDLVQFNEVVIENRETREERNRRREKQDKEKAAEGAAATEEKPAAEPAKSLTDEDIDKKIDAALKDNA